MATLQVKRVPEQLHAAVKARAAEEGITVSEFLLRTVKAAVERPSLHSWVDQVEACNAATPVRGVDVEALMDEVRDE